MSPVRTYKVGTRSSPLALKQVEEVLGLLKEFYPDLKVETVKFVTSGDKDKTTPISDIEGTDFFTREIDNALLRGEIDTSTPLSINGESFDYAQDGSPKDGELVEPRSRTIDFAVHSAKDLPDKIAGGLFIAAITKPLDNCDCLVSKNNLRLKGLPVGAKIGVSSLRRKTQLKAFRNDLRIVDIRGNIQERLKKLKEDNLDAVVVAACALIRLGLESRITERISLEILKPHPLQGSLAVVARKDDADLIRLLSSIDSRTPRGPHRGSLPPLFHVTPRHRIVAAGGLA